MNFFGGVLREKSPPPLSTEDDLEVSVMAKTFFTAVKIKKKKKRKKFLACLVFFGGGEKNGGKFFFSPAAQAGIKTPLSGGMWKKICVSINSVSFKKSAFWRFPRFPEIFHTLSHV